MSDIRRYSSDPGVSLFRVLARRWRPVVPVKHGPLLWRFALRMDEAPPVGRRSFGPKPKPPSVKTPRVAPSWNPWLWVK
jgi:hypothetical protein